MIQEKKKNNKPQLQWKGFLAILWIIIFAEKETIYISKDGMKKCIEVKRLESIFVQIANIYLYKEFFYD